MDQTGILLVAASCFAHAGWNLLAKKASGQADFFWWVCLSMAIGLAVPCGTVMVLTPLPATTIYCCLTSGVFLGLYFTCLMKAYRRGDLSIIYPLARSSPILMMACIRMIRGIRLDAWGLAGLALATIGAFLLPIRNGSGAKRWLNVGTLWAVLTGMCTAGYSLLDGDAMVAVKAPNPTTAGLVAQAVSYLWLQFTVGWLVMTALLWRTSAKPRRGTWRAHGRSAVLVACMNVGSYALVLVAMTTNEPTYVVALRQLSIVLTVLLGVTILHERRGAAHRLAGAAVIVAGLALVAMAKRPAGPTSPPPRENENTDTRLPPADRAQSQPPLSIRRPAPYNPASSQVERDNRA